MVTIKPRTQGLWAILCLAVAPIFLLGACLFGDRVFMPFDLAAFPPASLLLTDTEQATLDSQPGFHDVTEIPVLVEPEARLAFDELTEGRFPHWNPYARFGAPLFANSLAALAYPPNWFCVISSDPAQSLALGSYVSFLIAGLLMYGFLRQLQLRRSSALVGAFAFAFSGTMTVNAHFYMRMNALIWLPGMLWACLRISHSNGYDRIPPSIGLAICMAMTWLAGFPPFAAVCTLMTAAYAAILLIRELRRTSVRTSIPLATWLAGSAALGIALAAVQFLPLLAYLPESNRSLPPGPNGIAAQGFDPAALLGFIMPRFFGEPGGVDYAWSPYVHYLFSRVNWVADLGTGAAVGAPIQAGAYNYVEYTVFVGTLTLPLALLGLGHRGFRLRFPVMFTALGFVVIATAPSILSALYQLPGLKTIPPLRFMAPVTVILATFAAIGFDSLLNYAPLKRVRLVSLITAAFGGVLLLLAVWASVGAPPSESLDLVGSVADKYLPTYPNQSREVIHAIATDQFGSYEDARKPDSQTPLAKADRYLIRSLWRGALGLLLAAGWLLMIDRAFRGRLLAARNPVIALSLLAISAELLLFGSHWTKGRELARSIDTPVQSFLREKRDAYREAGGITVARVSHDEGKIAEDLPTGTLFPERIRDLNSYAFMDAHSHLPFAELMPKRIYNGFWPKAFPDDARLERPFFDLIGLRYLLSTERCEHAGRVTGPVVKGIGKATGRQFYIYERPNPMPRAFVVPRLEVVETPTEASVSESLAVARRLVSADLKPRDYALVTSDVAKRLPDLSNQTSSSQAPRKVSFIQDSPAALILHVEPADQPGYLVLADTFMSGWTATVNGAEVPLERANLFMRVIPVPATGAEIRYTYQTPGLTRGFAVTLGAFGMIGFMAISMLSSRRRKRRAED